MADRFNRIDNTAPIVDVAENTKPNVDYSNFDLSRKLVGQALPYAIIPIDVIETLPNTKVWLNYDVQITFRNPAVRKQMNGWRVYLHSYYNRKSDLWEGWNNFITCGRSGTMTNLEIPHISTRISKKDMSSGMEYSFTPFTPMSLYNYLGYASEKIPKVNNAKYLGKKVGNTVASMANGESYSTSLADYTNIKINALKPMMYQRLWRDKYAPKNLLQNNKNVFPDNEEHFILSYETSGKGIARIDYENEDTSSFKCLTSETLNDKNFITMNGKINNEDTPFRLDILRYRQFQGDRFTTASPFQDMLRGLAPSIDIEIDSSALKAIIPANSVLTERLMYKDSNGGLNKQLQIKGNGEGYSSHADASSGTTNWYQDNNGEFVMLQNAGISGSVATDNGNIYGVSGNEIRLNISGSSIASQITLSQLRSLEVFYIFKERMARTNGDYNEMIWAQFGHNPRWNDREAIYIGGSYQDILSNSIYSTAETENQPLGTQVSQGISASYNKIGEFTADDYGYVMTVMSIVPETIYTTGISKLDTALTMQEQYFPIMNNLSAEAILNQELYVSGTKATDEDVYGYAERFSEYKSRRSRVCGLSELANTDDEYDSALVMARRFNGTQNLNAEFVQGIPDNVSLDSFTSNDEAPFDFTIIQDVNVNYPMPYATIPAGLGTRA